MTSEHDCLTEREPDDGYLLCPVHCFICEKEHCRFIKCPDYPNFDDIEIIIDYEGIRNNPTVGLSTWRHEYTNYDEVWYSLPNSFHDGIKEIFNSKILNFVRSDKF